MSEDVKHATEIVTGIMKNLDATGRQRFVATLEGAAIGAELAARKEPVHEQNHE